ncbi:heavy-metal-associated domain-containing protein [Paraburkholderia fungorum]|jgi:copper chaperone|uniref:Copper chaperone n=1 Tax=Paraburkholderia fungorum TaxID=134537 RepID=A0AAW3V215_9BURK|nr:heavy-metal-associated domain-containing protein [Paraburkholderia fungorum]AJZ56180.1 heavy-metal-associated domain protein [Paraburkholderia fungorum]MBB4516629.1 copper chaperone [Paraburkholderia fungorum]MBB5545113.1 copper chaperone [Paraburkholderia fungorum]MBB6204898.1 copper chaperone [Paraburkholderia fungorum]MBU7442484.1 heavy-metal-associated domain-containing protein [Paraburkholderia fungorum]
MEFQVNDMSCGGCARSITNAVKQVDPAASVDVDIAQKTVKVSSSISPEKVLNAISEAGYNPVLKD